MIVFQDNYMIAANKPNNQLIHRSYMARNMDDEKTLLDDLKLELKQDLYPIHRLDRKTSGIILLAKSKEYITPFMTLFESNTIEKTYYALVRGHISEEKIIDSPVKGRDANKYKQALTVCCPLEQFTLNIPVYPYDNSRYTLVKLSPKTGRLHQLRIHMNKISHPIVGDPKYGDRFHNRMFEEKLGCNKLFLHAKCLKFMHPFTNKKTDLEVDFPEHWKMFNELENELIKE
ncbi:MAG: pseudouridine synthase [Flavobacteriaceae bacterium]|nr:pseudouridine synthase [Flavobacteriaceae bacterium]